MLFRMLDIMLGIFLALLATMSVLLIGYSILAVIGIQALFKFTSITLSMCWASIKGEFV